MAEKPLKSLAKETAIYGLSSIVGKFINWCLVPFYTFVLESSADYGIVTNLYAWTAFLVVILTYGMETGFFRFANKNKEEADKVYGVTLTSVGSTSLLFALCCIFFSGSIAERMGYANHAEFIAMLGVVVAMDAFASIPFAYLRFRSQALKFAGLKLLYIILNVFFNLFFFLLCPWLMQEYPAWVDWFYRPEYGVGYVFVANILSTALQTLCVLPFANIRFRFDATLLKNILRYSLPLLVLGIAGIMNQTVDKIIFPFLIEDKAEATTQLGIYGACFKIAMVMMMFTQAFRYAYEPFIFARHKDKNSLSAYADAMKFFVIFSLLIFLGMTFYLDLLKYLIRSDYWEGLKVVPVVLMSYIFQGIFFNLSLWYKLTDKTMYGAWLSILGLLITLAVNIVFVPLYGYMASAWASFLCYSAMMFVSYFWGQRHMAVAYDLKSIGLYTLAATILYGVSIGLESPSAPLNIGFRSLLLAAFVAMILKRDLPLQELPLIHKFIKTDKQKKQ